MPLSGVQPTGCGAILRAIGQRLLDKAVVANAAAIRFTVRPDVQHTLGEHDILIRPMNFMVDQNSVASTGRIATVVTRLITTVCRTRLHLDEAGSEKMWLLGTEDADTEPTDETLGHLTFEENTVDALHMFWPVTSDGNPILQIPMRLLRMDSLGKDTKDGAWGRSALDWEVKYVLALDQNDQ